MLDRQTFLLTLLAEECSEVSQRASKAIRFGLSECQTGQDLRNDERIVGEVIDLITVLDILVEEGYLPSIGTRLKEKLVKKAKIEKYYELSKSYGRVE